MTLSDLYVIIVTPVTKAYVKKENKINCTIHSNKNARCSKTHICKLMTHCFFW